MRSRCRRPIKKQKPSRGRKICQKVKFRSENKRAYARAENGKRKRNTTAQDMPKEANDTDDAWKKPRNNTKKI